MVVDSVDRFKARQAQVRSENAKRALLFLASKSPEMRELLTSLAKLELERRKA